MHGPWFATALKPSRTFDAEQAAWVAGVLGKLIHGVGPDTLLGLVLRQTRAEVNSLIASAEAEEADAPETAKRAA
jgi:hypothetical protein